MRATDILEALQAAGQEIRDVTARLENRDAMRVAGYEFNGGTLAGTEQHNAYRAKLDEIHSLALQIRKGR